MPPKEPWIFRYVEDPSDETAKKLGQPAPLRPAVAVRLVGKHRAPRVLALVDSGSERVLAAPGLARAVGVDLAGAPETEIGIGGEWRRIRVAEVTIQLYRTIFDDHEDHLTEWRTDVGFFSSWSPAWAVVLGRAGFFDQFTTTMQGAIPAMAVEPPERFDERFGIEIEAVDTRQPRFKL